MSVRMIIPAATCIQCLAPMGASQLIGCHCRNRQLDNRFKTKHTYQQFSELRLRWMESRTGTRCRAALSTAAPSTERDWGFSISAQSGTPADE